jgi:hypothetical protein
MTSPPRVGSNLFLQHPNYIEAAKQFYDAQVVEPKRVYVNLMTSIAGGGPAHTDSSRIYDMSTLPIPSTHLVVVSVGTGLWLCAIGSVVGVDAGIKAVRTCQQDRSSRIETFGQ